jgi:hypothetical protein
METKDIRKQAFTVSIYHADKKVKLKDLHECLGKLSLRDKVVFIVEKIEQEKER